MNTKKIKTQIKTQLTRQRIKIGFQTLHSGRRFDMRRQSVPQLRADSRERSVCNGVEPSTSWSRPSDL